MRLTIKTGEKVKTQIGGLLIEVLNREVGDDFGMSVEVYPEDDPSNQLLRFDCFHDDPHYHVPPSAPGQLNIDKEKYGDGLDWAIEQIRNNVVSLVDRAGFPEISQKLNQNDFRRDWQKIKMACESAPEPSVEKTVELTEEQLKQIRGEE